MNPLKCTRNDFVNFLIAAFQTCSCTEASHAVSHQIPNNLTLMR
jgi:hypothetical protein